MDVPRRILRIITDLKQVIKTVKKYLIYPLDLEPKQAKLWPRLGPLVRAPDTRSFQHWPTLFVALRVSDATRFAIFTAMWFAQRRWWLTGGDIETFPRLTRRGFFCLRFEFEILID